MDTKLGEVVQITLKTGERIRGLLIEKTSGGFRLSDSMISDSESDEDSNWTTFPGFIEVNWSSIESFQIISQGP